MQGSLACQLSALLRAHLFRLEVQLTFLSLSFAAHIIPYLSFAVLVQFVSETLAPSSLFDIFACSLLWQPRESITCLIFGPHHNPDSLSLSLSLSSLSDGRRWTGNWRTPSLLFHRHLHLCVVHASSLALITLRLPGDQLATAGALSLEHPPLSSLVQSHYPKPNTPWQAI